MTSTKLPKWKPITEDMLLEKIDAGVSRLIACDLKFWELVKLPPAKWEEDKYGRPGRGFWVVAIAGSRIIWYNDIEEGFNISRYTKFGKIDQYFANQDDLDSTVRQFFELVRFSDV